MYGYMLQKSDKLPNDMKSNKAISLLYVMSKLFEKLYLRNLKSENKRKI